MYLAPRKWIKHLLAIRLVVGSLNPLFVIISNTSFDLDVMIFF